MDKRWGSFLILVLVFMFICSPHPGVVYGQPALEYRFLDVPLFAQQTKLWCWAAGGEMIMTYLGKKVPQCEQVNDELARKDCCYNYDSFRKVSRPWPKFKRYGFPSYKRTIKFLTWDKLVCQINRKKPIGFCQYRKDGSSHYMVITGYIAINVFKNDFQLLMVNDPLPWNCCNKLEGGEVKLITYPGYVGGDGHRQKHWWSDRDDGNCLDKQ